MIHLTKNNAWHDGNTLLQTQTYFIRYIVIHADKVFKTCRELSQQNVGKHRARRTTSSTYCQGKSGSYEQELVLGGMEIADSSIYYTKFYKSSRSGRNNWHVAHFANIKFRQPKSMLFARTVKIIHDYFCVDRLSFAFNLSRPNTQTAIFPLSKIVSQH